MYLVYHTDSKLGEEAFKPNDKYKLHCTRSCNRNIIYIGLGGGWLKRMNKYNFIMILSPTMLTHDNDTLKESEMVKRIQIETAVLNSQKFISKY